MLKNYFQTFLNLAVKHKFYGLINVFSLALGLTSVLLIAAFVLYELSFDRHYAKAERIYRVAVQGEGGPYPESPAPLAALLQREFSTIETTARFGTAKLLLQYEDVLFHEDKLAFADNALFELFDFRWISGNPAAALVGPNSIVLTESLARKYFGSTDPMGLTLTLEGNYPLVVTGLIEDLPENTHLAATAIASLQAREPSLEAFGGFLNNWNALVTSTYVLLRQDADIASIENGLPAFVEGNVPDPEPGDGLSLTALTAIHLNPEAAYETGAGSKVTLAIFSAAAFCVLLLSMANFINLSIARYSWRIKEVGVRKSVGASRVNLIVQFIGEGVLITIAAMVLALGLTELLLPVARGISGQALSFPYLSSSPLFFMLAGFTLLLGFAAGVYPAFYLSAFRPVHVLRGNLSRGQQNIALRNCLVVGQFSVSIIIIVAALAMYAQMQYLESSDLGYVPEEVVVLTTPASWSERRPNSWQAFKNSLLTEPGITSVTHSQGTPLQLGNIANQFHKAGETERHRIPLMNVSHDFFGTYGIEFLAGRDFSQSLDSDLFYPRDAANPGSSLSGAYILNSEAVRLLGWAADAALGKELYFGDSEIPGEVIGVVNDTVKSTKELVSPAVYYISRGDPFYAFAGKISILLSGTNQDAALAHIDRTWREFFPEEPIARVFLASEIEALYQREGQQSVIFSYFSVLSVFLSCMGLLGLAAFNAESRVKEIGVRKVMGGSIWSIVLLLTNDFSKLVLMSNLLAWPVAYFAMSRWLENFAYRIDLTPLIFIGSGLIALCIAWVTVGGTAAKAANQKPVLALRYE